MADETKSPGRSGFWTFNAGQIITVIVFMVGIIYGASAFATKSTNDIADGRVLASELKARVDAADVRSSLLESRVVAIETGINYIRESLARIENALNKK